MSYIPKPEPETVPARPPPAERSVGQPFYLAQRNPNDPLTHVDPTTGRYSLTPSQIMDPEALEGCCSSALSMAEYVFNMAAS